jgi:hypothetical protein
MAWETRPRGRRYYYYRSVRVDGRPTKVYLGRGEAAKDQARRDANARHERQGEREAVAAARTEVAAADTTLADLEIMAGLLFRATLITAGYHLDHREWRRRRAHRNTDAHD